MSVGKDKKGNWYAAMRYTDWQGVVRQKKKTGFKTQKEATEYESEFILQQKALPNMKFASLVELYLVDCTARIKKTTIYTKQKIIETHIIPFFGNKSIDTITPVMVRQWQNGLLTNPKNFEPTYLKTIHNQLSAIFNFAVKYYNLKANPAGICGSMGKKNADGIEFWTTSEYSNFIKSVLDTPHNKEFYTIYNLLFFTGIRSGEMFALTLSDFDFENKTVSISKTYSKLNGEDLITTPKTPKSKRVISMSSKLCDIVQNYIGTLYSPKKNERIFSATKSQLEHFTKKAIKESGNKHIRIHDFRHSHASHLIELGFSPLLISERLGHENIQTTLQTYSHLYPNKHSEVADKLDEFIL